MSNYTASIDSITGLQDDQAILFESSSNSNAQSDGIGLPPGPAAYVTADAIAALGYGLDSCSPSPVIESPNLGITGYSSESVPQLLVNQCSVGGSTNIPNGASGLGWPPPPGGGGGGW